MKTILAATAAMGLAIAAVPAVAQMNNDSMGEMNSTGMQMTAQQQAAYDGWRQSRQAAYDTWDDKTKTYFWTLDPMEMEGWWALSDAQKAKVLSMTPEQQAQTWASIKSQLASTPATSSTTSSTTSSGMSSSNSGNMSSSASTPRYVSNEMVQNMGASKKPAGGDYPVCTKNMTDNCVNPGAR
ncbi:hypothetical protein MKP08_09320 [Erythrobacter sp. LQ02-29]|uniref:hypothetical protein n=1 Tax=Erythrobacter sp. LQ02-29 TaxID=2920384 RepID=UPI001F4E7B26|nr:hypothetical protein [Erythrobacter sp. LQ02-29]MCP9222945.1 hypothetical protein [Erythrobacter sp. LQ02-29]